MKMFYYLSITSFKFFFKIFHRNKVFGLENLPKGRAIIAPNHLSYYDPPLIAGSIPEDVHFLARSSLFRNRFFRYLIMQLNAHPVQGGTQDLSSFKLILQLLEQDKKVAIFPEGHRSLDGNLSSIKSGIGMLGQRSKAPIIPTYIHGTFEVWNRFHSYPKLHGQTAVVFGKPINCEAFASLDKKQAQEEIAKSVQKTLESLRQWYEAGAQGSPP